MRHTPHDGTHPQAERWVIFDNTAAGLAVPNALQLQRLLGTDRKR